MGIKRVDKRRMEELRVEFGVEENFKKKLVRNLLKWVGHVERLGYEKWQREQICPESETERVGEEKGRKKVRRTKDRGNWILLIENIRREKLGERRGRKQMMEMETRANLTPDNNDVMSRTS